MLPERLQQHKIHSFGGHKDLGTKDFLVITKAIHLSGFVKTFGTKSTKINALGAKKFMNHDSYC